MMDGQVQAFNEHRPLLFGIAWRMLGNPTDAEDILQEAFVRWQRTSEADIRSPRAFLVTVVTRLCLNHLDLARVKREQGTELSLDDLPSPDASPASDADLAEALDEAFSIVLRCLSPVERAVFLLREAFDCDYIEIARVVEKNEDNCRQILRRAKERIAGQGARFQVTVDQQEKLLQEFLSATTTGDLDRLARALTQEVTLVCDASNLGAIAPPPIEGAAAVSQFLISKSHELLPGSATLRRTLFRETPLLLAYRGEQLINALALVLRDGQISTVYLITCPVRLRFLSAQCGPSMEVP